MAFFFNNLFILSILFEFSYLQQIFENAGNCEFSKLQSSSKDSIKLKSTIWQVRSSQKQLRDHEVFISLCGMVPPRYGCKSGTSACILNRKDSKQSILNAGEFFELDYDQERDKDILRSVNGQQCSKENFTVIIELNCAANTQESPKFLYKDECELRLEMLSPNCNPSCTARIGGHLIDLRNFKKLGSLSVQSSVGKTFVLSFCNDAVQCGSGVAACETSNGITPIADFKSLSISYDDSQTTNTLVLKAHYGSGRRRLNTEILLHCKWNEPGISNLLYLAPKTQGKNFKFKAESALACIKIPMNCMIVDSTDTYYVYDLKSLNRPQRGWKVANTTTGIMNINMCGPLNMSPNNICSAQYSQVCFKSNQNTYLNLGTVASNFHITIDHTVKAFFTGGSTCLLNTSIAYSTEIEFFCSKEEQGPILQSENMCSYTIHWRTPAACPKNMATQSNCLMSDAMGNIDLNSIHKPKDTIQTLSPNMSMRYNLCGNLTNTCNNHSDVSVCYIKNGKEHIIGYTNKVLTRYNTLLSLNLVGDKCDVYGMRSKTKVHFTCNYLTPIEGKHKIKAIKENCIFEIHIDTPLACVKPVIVGCRLYNTNSLYDLTPLVHNSSNYIVRDPNDRNIDYILNICHSVIPAEDIYCPAKTGVCIRNSSEPHIEHMFKSLGNIIEATELTLTQSGNLELAYTSGPFCRAEFTHYSTTVEFECSMHQEEPQILTKKPCSYKFLWRTPHACPKKIFGVKKRSSPTYDCVLSNSAQKQDLYLGVLDWSFSFGDVEYQFNICEQNYSHCVLNDNFCKSSLFKTEMSFNNEVIYLKLILNDTCEKDIKANVIYIELICDKSHVVEKFEFIKLENCTVYINFFSNNKCLVPEQANPIEEIELLKISKNIVEELSSERYQYLDKTVTDSDNFVTTKVLVHPYDCYVENVNGIFKLKDMNFQVFSNVKVYTVSFGENIHDCPGYVCVNGVTYLERTEECPIVAYSEVAPVITLKFTSNQTCNEARVSLEVWLKCNSTSQEQASVQESKCKIVITYPTQDACFLLEKTTIYSSSSASTVIGVSLGFVAFVLMVLIVFITKKYFSNKRIFECGRSYKTFGNKQQTPVYYKDTNI